MVRKLVFFGILVPLALLLVMFAVANREVVTVSFDPFDRTDPALSLRMPLFVMIFVFLGLGVLIGGFAAWLRQARYRRTARNLRTELAGLRREVELLNARLDEAPAYPPSDAPRLPLRSPAA